MDKKNTILGILCILAGIGFMVKQTADVRKQQLEQAEQERAFETSGQAETVETEELAGGSADDKSIKDVSRSIAEPVVAAKTIYPQSEEKIVTLANEFIEIDFTTAGGAIKTVHFLKTKKGDRDTYVYNEDSFLPALSLSLTGNKDDLSTFTIPYTIKEQTAYSITFETKLAGGLILQRIYSLSGPNSDRDPYEIKNKTIFINESDIPKSFPELYLNLGTAHSISEKQPQNFLNVGYFDGKKARFTAINKLTGSRGFLGFGGSEPVDRLEKTVRSEWVSVKNQFFASILSAREPGRELLTYKVDLPELEDGSQQRPAISSSVGYDLGTVAASSTKTLEFDFYVGPKEYKRLQAMDNQQDRVMQFGFLSAISKLLLSFMYGIHKFVPNWGWSIVIMTICIKLLFWPLSAKASRSQKRMAKIQEPMKELKEKYKDNPQKFQKEMLVLFKKHKVNPVAGCLPMIIQMPIFVGLFYMLRTASELRHESFLWVSDLSMPDTLGYIAGFPINILPLIMGLSMFFQMSMAPVSPTADPAQQKIFKFLPFIFLIFLYNFSSGLVLYWTVQNFLTIVQQMVINRLPDVELSEPATPASTNNRKIPSEKKSQKKR